MSERTYWYLSTGRPSILWWPEVTKWTHEEGNERVEAPMIFSSREAAEAELARFEETEVERYLGAVGRFGEDAVNEAKGPWSPRVFELDGTRLADLLEGSDFLCVLVDHRMIMRQDFLDDLKGDADGEEAR